MNKKLPIYDIILSDEKQGVAMISLVDDPAIKVHWIALSGDMAVIGPKGDIKPSKKAPKSSTPNPNPEGRGTAKGSAATTRGAKVSAEVEASLQKKADDFNEKYKDKLGFGVNIGMLKSVYQRGLGAFATSHSPAVKSAGQWAQARVNAFLYIVKNGRPQNPKYTRDNDLLPGKHKKKGEGGKEDKKEDKK